MPLKIQALLVRPEGERTGKFLRTNFGKSFWDSRTGQTPDPTAYVTSGSLDIFRDTASNAAKEAANIYWANMDYGEYVFLALRESKEDYTLHLVAVNHAIDDSAPVAATHKAFVLPTGEKKADSGYVTIAPGGNPKLRRVDLPVPDRVPPPSMKLEVWDNVREGYSTKTSDEMADFILETDPRRGSSNVKRCVSMMGRGGKHTIHYEKDRKIKVLHASKGKRGDSSTTTIFYVEMAHAVRLVGFGFHTGNASYSVVWQEPNTPTILPASIALGG